MSDRRITFTDGHPDPEWLGALHDGELSTGEAREVQAHAAACAACRQALAELSELSGLTPELEPPLPEAAYWPGLTERIMARVAAEQAPESARAAAALRPAAEDLPDATAPTGLLRSPRSSPVALWRWAVPLAAVCGVALLSWRLLVSRPSMMSLIGSPTPSYERQLLAQRSKPPKPAAQTDQDTGRPAGQTEAFGGARAGKDSASQASGRAPTTLTSPGAPAAPRAEMRRVSGIGSGGGGIAADGGRSAGQPAPVAPPPTNAVPAGPPADVLAKGALSPGASPPAATEASSEARLNALELTLGGSPEEETGQVLGRYRARLAAGAPAESVLAQSGREADSLWVHLSSAVAVPRAPATRTDFAERAGKGPGPTAPPDTLVFDRAIAVEQARLALLGQLRPGFDRAPIEARIAWLRKNRKKQEP